MRIAFYRAAPGGLIDHLINLFSGRIGFSHVELVFSTGEFFSSSGRDRGVRFKCIDPKSSRWVMMDLAISPADESRLRRFCQKQVGRKYDWWGVLRFVLPLRPHKSRWFCSEIVVAALKSVGFIESDIEAWKFSPNSLFLLLSVLISQGKPNA